MFIQFSSVFLKSFDPAKLIQNLAYFLKSIITVRNVEEHITSSLYMFAKQPFLFSVPTHYQLPRCILVLSPFSDSPRKPFRKPVLEINFFF